ncbi:MAG: hypothetical protein HOL15_04485 [Nitrospinaceae bacterium]|nr:hypothetical protein [Nitrospina sp.]MBT5376051.1 hypothetical protein [Nitrospinaceae bacterium]MBT5869001.1 hypothetical protein [Nitrospinaceae bacterium]MBT6347126.1 hypothetical protein [Nitrospina sp.]
MQTTYPKRKPAKPASHYILPIALLAVMVLIINTMFRISLPDPLGEKIQSHMTSFQKPIGKG